MAEMTIRLDDEAIIAVEELKKLFGERTSNKAILACLKRYKTLYEESKKYRSAWENSVKRFDYVKRAYEERERWNQVLKDCME